MTDHELDGLVRALHELPVAAMLTDLPTRVLIAVNDAAAAMFGTPVDDLVGTDILEHVDPTEREAARSAYAAMADKAIDGFQVQRRIVTTDGEKRTVSVCGRRVDVHDHVYGLWVLLPASATPRVVETLMTGASAVALAVTDHDWQIEYISADADHLVGEHGSQLRGFPLLGLVHPSAAGEFLAAAERASNDGHAVTVRCPIRNSSENWSDRYCLMVPICEHHPPRLGVVISAGRPPTEAGTGGPLDELLRQAAVETRAVQTLDAIPALADLAPGKELSARQTEIVARLVSGQSAASIARSMFLSPSTVRNHLHAIYQKFDVHSQAQLLAALIRRSHER